MLESASAATSGVTRIGALLVVPFGSAVASARGTTRAW